MHRREAFEEKQILGKRKKGDDTCRYISFRNFEDNSKMMKILDIDEDECTDKYADNDE